MIDKEKFIDKIKKCDDTVENLAAFLGCTRVSLYNKLNGKQFFTEPELTKIYSRYPWTPTEFIMTFIFKDLQNNDLLIGVEKVILDYSM